MKAVMKQEPSIKSLTIGVVAAMVAALSTSANEIAFFEQAYGRKFEGVKPKEEYSDPDKFYTAIAAQLGIPKKAADAVAEKFGWKLEPGKNPAAIVRRGPNSDRWEVMVFRFSFDKKTGKPDPASMENKFVTIRDDGKVEFPLEGKKNAQRKKTDPNSKTTDTSSRGMKTLAKKKAFLERYVKFRRRYKALDFHITYHDGGGGLLPSPSEWHIRLRAVVPAEELDLWIGGLKATKSPKTGWLADVPGAPTDLNGFAWFAKGGRTVGINRMTHTVLFRDLAL